ncbi:MAG: homoserine dehydrogenase [Candidatus Limnocylindrales bacterium]
MALAGYGAVGRALTALLARSAAEVARRYGVAFEVTAVATRGAGLAVNADGMDRERLAVASRAALPSSTLVPEAVLDSAPPRAEQPAPARSGRWQDLVAFLADPAAPYDVLVETTTQSPADGEPAATYVRAALRSAHDVVTANKGPIAWHGPELDRLAASTGARLRYEAALMDCLPTHAIREFLVPVGRVLSFAGIVNATTNVVLSAMADGRGAAEALAGAQRAGLAEADARNDLEGHDAALKATILANLLLDPREPVRPDRVERHGLEAVPDAWPVDAASRSARVRLVARGESEGEDPRRTVHVRVGPEELPLEDSLATVGGTSMALRVASEFGGRLQLTLLDAPVEQTAYAILMDLVALGRDAG